MILVTGITGLTGKFLYKEIKENFNNQDVKYLVRETSDISWINKNDQIVYGNLKDPKSTNEALKGVDIVLHLAPRFELQSIIDACMVNEIKRIFYVNSTGIYSKFKKSSHIDLRNEQNLKKSGLIYTIIRPTMIYGNHQDVNIHLLVKIMDKTSIYPILGKGKGLMQPIYAGDLAKVIVSALNNEALTRYKDYNVAGKSPLQYKVILANIAKAMGKRVNFIKIPYKLALMAGKIGDMIPNRIVDYEKVLRLVEDKDFDYIDASEDLGFDPISFEDGIVLEVNDLKKHGIIK